MAATYSVYKLDRLVKPYYVVSHHEHLGHKAIIGFEMKSVLFASGFNSFAEAQETATNLNIVREVLEL